MSDKSDKVAEYLEQLKITKQKILDDQFYDPNIKTAYFQGTEEPTPKKKQYKSDKAILQQTRFKEPLYKNYDYVDQPGVNGPAKHGPGSGYTAMQDYKSVSDFLKARRKKLKDKYKADDSYIEDDGSLTKSEKKSNKIARRMIVLSSIIKNAIDFPIDDQINSTPIVGDAGTYSDSIPIGGQLDEYLAIPDFEGKSADQLNFGRDYVEDSHEEAFNKINELQSLLDELIAGSLSPKETDLYGLPDGISPKEDLDMPSDQDSSNYGTTNSGNTLYEKMWI